MLDLDTKINLFAEYLDNGGYDRIQFKSILESLAKVTTDKSGKVVPESVDSLVNAAMNAYISTQLMEPYTSHLKLSEYESFIQKNIFFTQHTLKTKEEFENFILKYENQTNLIYRGVKEARWRLYSSLQRHWIINKYVEKKVDHKNFIIDLINNGRKVFHGTLTKFFIKNNIDPANDLAVLSFLQHYRQPTPLLDWTENLANALFFAIDDIDLTLGTREIHQYFSIYVLDGDLFAGRGIKKIMESKIKSYSSEFRKGLEKHAKMKGLKPDTFNKLFSDEIMKTMTVMKIGNKFASELTNIPLLYDLSFACFSDKIDDMVKFGLNNNIRITNQEGVFTWNAHPYLPIEHVILNNFKNESDSDIDICYCINIHKSLKPIVMDYLKKKAVDKKFIYPDSELLSKSSFKQTLKHFNLKK